MSAAHQQELYDDHILEEKWNKMTIIVNTLLKKHKQAYKGLEDMEGPYIELIHGIGEDQIRKWSDKESEALRLRGEHPDIYVTKVEKGLHPWQISSFPLCPLPLLNIAMWEASAGINIEDSQDLVREAVHQLPADPTATQKANVMAKQLALQSKVQKHQDEADSFMDGVDILEHSRPMEPMDDGSLLSFPDGGIGPLDAGEQDQEDKYVKWEDI
ncbi:hypothetical protein PAXRUDRAFT_10631 [Paxillus rubicundulus Ve08.2h10]|uniref:Uncharacterized protein n=1 Tax=Paxillus rubicundulus Ve08.2h10 TaxID=930991 RepID=A0A0D0DG12_9AGAM|nr:hypothetical protein PAXRUDRAFT_10631 [Paxillus rubicundulus Ve08.2h10]